MTRSILRVLELGWNVVIELSRYSTVVFDCDGVILDSNRIKTEAFRIAALPWGAAAADRLVAHHVANGGVSRYAKFAHFLSAIVPETSPNQDGPGLAEMLDEFASAVRRGLETCPVTAGLHELRAQQPDCRWLVVSGGDQSELREVFSSRGLMDLFDGGVFGSPDEKKKILARELARGNIRLPAIYLGDSKYDHECAIENGLDFVFVSEWSEVADWQSFVERNRIQSVSRIADFLAR